MAGRNGRGRRPIRMLDREEGNDSSNGEVVEAPKAAFVRAPAVQSIAQNLIPDYHPHLKEARVLFLFSGKKMTSRGKPVWGKAMRMTDMQRFLSAAGADWDETEGFDFAIVVNRETWDGELDEKQRTALVDHELCHCVQTPKGKWAIRDHEIEEFSEVIERHGLWAENVQAFGQAVVEATQQRLPLVGAAT